MTNLVPGAIWHPIDVGSRAKRRKGRGSVGHVAVSNSVNLVPSGTAATRSADWHLYLPKVGPPIQYIDLDLQCWATSAGNADLVAWESQGGMGTTAQVNAEPWTDNQLHWAAVILAHLHTTEGVPLEVMPDSLPASKGFGTHRLGISPWRVAGGQVWSSSNGKICPGDAKHAQRFQVVELARQIVNPTAPTIEDWFDMATREDLVSVLRSEGVSGAGDPAAMMSRGLDTRIAQVVAGVLRSEGVSGAGDVGRMAEALTPQLSAKLAEASDGSPAGTLTKADVEDALRNVFSDAAGS